MKKPQAPTPYNTPSIGFKDTMEQAQGHMNKPARLFSYFIHLRPVEAISNVLAVTLFQPIAIISGSIFAIIIPLALWMIAKYYGYGLSGSESLVSFAIGWLIGFVINYLRVMITGKDTSLET